MTTGYGERPDTRVRYHVGYVDSLGLFAMETVSAIEAGYLGLLVDSGPSSATVKFERKIS